ncbi:MAG TPA: tetratricopeptide repeat protein [Paenalcaligenes sp.]|nr:tetratricopeptide repeat protein [Paenalcaligenes sp.]
MLPCALASAQTPSSLNELLAQENSRAGTPAYDLKLGTAALHEDAPTVAVMAFERCLAVTPDHEQCRLGLAHAYIMLSEKQNARAELQHLQKQQPSPEIQKSIAHYLDLLSQAESKSEVARLSSYIQVGLGYDSNINSAADLSEIALPGDGDIVYLLPKEHQRTKSAVMTARYHIRYSTPINEQWRFTAQGNIATRGNFKTSRYNTLVSDVSVGLARSVDRHELSARIKLQNYRLRNKNFRNMGTLIGQYAYSVNSTTELSAFAQASKLNYSSSRYAQDNSRRNARRYIGGASLLKGFADERALAYATLYGGTHRKSKSRAPTHINHDIAGLRIGGMYLVTPRFQIEGGVAVERRRFKDTHPSFEKRRRDTFYDAYLGAIYAINRKLTLRPQYQFYRNHSNLALGRYKRHIFMVNLRYDLL